MKRSHSLFLLFLIVSCLFTVSFSQSSTHKTRGEITTERLVQTWGIDGAGGCLAVRSRSGESEVVGGSARRQDRR